MKKSINFLYLILVLSFILVGCSDNYDETKILKEPPNLTIMYEENSINALRGGYSWTIHNNDGTSSNMIADSAHPLECRDIMPFIIRNTNNFVTLKFDVEPDSISVRSWSDKYWNDVENGEKNFIKIKTENNNTINLIDDKSSVIYEILATWNSSDTYKGSSYYSFYVKNNK